MNRRDWIENPKIVYHPEWLKRWHKDPFSVPPIYIEISPVGMCNHRCTFCAPEMLGYPNRQLDPDILIARLKEMQLMRENDPDDLGVRSIQYAGEGEPTLYKDLARVFKATREAGIDIGMLTNGTGLTEKLAWRIVPLVNGYIQASVNAGTAESYAKIHRAPIKHWDLVWRNLEKAVEIKRRLGASECEIGVNMTVLIKEAPDPERDGAIVPANWREMELLVKRARDCGLDYVSFKPYSQHSYSRETAKLYGDMTYKDVMNEIFEMGTFLTSRFGSDLFEVIFSFTRFSEYEEEERKYTTCRSTPTIWSYIQSDGVWISCTAHWTNEKFHLGNINNQSIGEIWYGELRKEHLRFVLEELDIAECRKTCHPDKENRFLEKLAGFSDLEFERIMAELKSIPRPKRANFI
jgi:cyclic pyranopterin phosphate synthase